MTSNLTMAQYRYMRPLGTCDRSIGRFGSIQESFSSLYPDINLLTFNTATFSQIEWAKGWMEVAGGVRAERNFFPSIFDEKLRSHHGLGLISELSPATNLRMSMASRCASHHWLSVTWKAVWATTLTSLATLT